MPLYEYKCENCGKEFEELVSYSEADKVNCCECGSKKTVRQASTCSSVIEGGSSTSSTPPVCNFGGG